MSENKIETGGPAFPAMVTEYDTSSGQPEVTHIGGMTLRDYFAAKALVGELAAQDARHDGKGTGVLTPDPETMVNFAKRCYQIADAMLKARAPTHED